MEQQNAEIFVSKSVSLLYVSLTGEISNCSFGALFVCQPICLSKTEYICFLKLWRLKMMTFLNLITNLLKKGTEMFNKK